MSFNVTLFGKVLYVTPWMVYNTHHDEIEPSVLKLIGSKFSFNNYRVHYLSDVKEEMSDSGIIRNIVPELCVGNAKESDFTRVFPSYGTILGLVGLGLGAKYGYQERKAIGDSFRGMFRLNKN